MPSQDFKNVRLMVVIIVRVPITWWGRDCPLLIVLRSKIQSDGGIKLNEARQTEQEERELEPHHGRKGKGRMEDFRQKENLSEP